MNLSRFDFCCPQRYSACYSKDSDYCCYQKADSSYKYDPCFASRQDPCCRKKCDPCTMNKLFDIFDDLKYDPCYSTRCSPCSPKKYDPCPKKIYTCSSSVNDPCCSKQYNPCPPKYNPCLYRKLDECSDNCEMCGIKKRLPNIFQKYDTSCRDAFKESYKEPCREQYRNPSKPQYIDPCRDSCRDPCKSQYRDPCKDPRRDPFKDPCRDPFKDPCKDRCRDPCKDPCREPCRDPCKDQYRDPCRCREPCKDPSRDPCRRQPKKCDPCSHNEVEIQNIPKRKITPCETIILSKCDQPKEEPCKRDQCRPEQPSCDKFNKVCYPREIPVKADDTRRCEINSPDTCDIRKENECERENDECKQQPCKGADSCCLDRCDNQDPSSEFLEKFYRLGKLPRHEKHMCPWEADVTVNGNVRAHCDSTAVEIAKKMTGRYRAEGERCTSDSCANVPVDCEEDNQHLNLGILDDGTYLDFSRNNKVIRNKSRNRSDNVHKLIRGKDVKSDTSSTSEDNCGHLKSSTVKSQRTPSRSRPFQFLEFGAEGLMVSHSNANENGRGRYFEVCVTNDATMTKRCVHIGSNNQNLKVKRHSDTPASRRGSPNRKPHTYHDNLFGEPPSSSSSEVVSTTYCTASEMRFRPPERQTIGRDLKREVDDFLKDRKSRRRHKEQSPCEETFSLSHTAPIMPRRLSLASFNTFREGEHNHRRHHAHRSRDERRYHLH
ncbi:hypothetical protein BgiMline_001072 [Biomphalaria glabrata]|nr:hypothetical protein BgiMline_000995 [Biomphalaria glabrata]